MLRSDRNLYSIKILKSMRETEVRFSSLFVYYKTKNKIIKITQTKAFMRRLREMRGKRIMLIKYKIENYEFDIKIEIRES